MQEVGSLRREVDRLAQQINNPIIDYPTPVPPIVEQINGATTSYTTFDSSPIDNGELMKQLQNQIDIERNRANAILEWYRKEYEILPRWYKKFGHVIKVFKGKRTFKSLFK